MSNSIWKTPDQKPDIDKQIIIINDFGYVIYFGKCAVAPGNKWCDIDDLIAQADKAERLQKGIDLLFRQASVWSWQTAPTPDKKIVLSRRQILGWLKKLKEIVKGE